MKKSCELCKNMATIYCESDQASLCWTCDAKVHSANFLVARHSRNLLCHECQSATPWTASGSKLGPTLSVCVNCFHGEEEGESNGGPVDEDISESEDDSDNDDSDNDDDDDDADVEEEENQVVPWSTIPSSPSSPPVASSSSSSEESSDDQPEVSRKRVRHSFLDRRCNGDSEQIYRQNVRAPPILTEAEADDDGSGGDDDDGTANVDSSSTSSIRRRRRMRPFKGRRIESGRVDGVV